MARHTVKFTITDRPIQNVDLVFNVFEDNSKLGELRVSKGGLGWVPTNGKKPIPLAWRAFDSFMLKKSRT